jgi:hypothetical protein
MCVYFIDNLAVVVVDDGYADELKRMLLLHRRWKTRKKTERKRRFCNQFYSSPFFCGFA